MSELYTQNCPDCGICFGIPKEMEQIWRNSHKGFFCPNGHSLSWKAPAETEEQKELKTLRTKVTDLETKLATASQEAADQKKRADDLQAELEIWRPTTKE